MIRDHLRRSQLEKSSMYSSEYTSGFSGPAASHLAAPPSPRYEGNARQTLGPTLPNKRLGDASENEDVNTTSEGVKHSLRAVSRAPSLVGGEPSRTLMANKIERNQRGIGVGYLRTHRVPATECAAGTQRFVLSLLEE